MSASLTRLVRVEWLDASDPPGESSWYSEADIEGFAAGEVLVTSVGWVKSDTRLYLTLVADYIINPDGTLTLGRPTKIPHGMIRSVQELVPAPAPQTASAPQS